MKIILCLILISGMASAQQSSKGQNKESLFKLNIIKGKNNVVITPPRSSDFTFPEDASKADLIKSMDFNADGKKDVLINFGACGTGGCMLGLFLNKSNKFYSLAFFDYLKNPEYIKSKSGQITIKSSQEVEAYNPSKLEVSIYKYDSKTSIYKLVSKKIEFDN